MAAFPTSRSRAGANNAINFEVLMLNYELCAQGTNYVLGFQSFMPLGLVSLFASGAYCSVGTSQYQQ